MPVGVCGKDEQAVPHRHLSAEKRTGQFAVAMVEQDAIADAHLLLHHRPCFWVAHAVPLCDPIRHCGKFVHAKRDVDTSLESNVGLGFHQPAATL